ncbi:ethanolamine utilization protein [Maledivibacter halophilus]|uniref:Ethanolamine utilization protein n=2 Tax=Maledivibacter halophilus TaxID=36842 RepID=A0A1T5M1A1_9FIRM|nr:ethanolamine utilization protein [Maledivibacter halophilus]
MVDNLSKIIAQEVLKRIKESENYMDIVRSKKLLILDNSSNKENYADVYFKKTKVKFLNESCIEELDSFKYIIAPNLSNKDLAGIALGIEKSNISRFIIEGILRGKKIIAIEDGIEYKKFKERSNLNFFRIFEEYQEKIMKFGISVVKRENLYMIFKEKETKNFSKKLDGLKENLDEALLNKKVIIEKDIYNAYNIGYKNICINKKSIITPLAVDYIKSNKINIRYK